MTKDLFQKLFAVFAVVITLYAIYLRGENESAAIKIDGIGKSMGIVTLTALDSFEISSRDIFVPAYRDTTWEALAVNAELYKGSFGAANYTFRYPAGFYDLILTTLKERAGQSSYRIMVDQKTWSSFQNDTTSVNYALQEHRVKGVYIAEGEVVQVQFNSHSNKTIPEGESFAYSRGRWRSLRVEPVGK